MIKTRSEKHSTNKKLEYSFGHSYAPLETSINVLLAPINEDKDDDNNLEPQYVKVKPNYRAQLYLSVDCNVITGNGSYSCIPLGGRASRIRRIAVNNHQLNFQVPCINSTNNTFTFQIDTLATFTVTLAEAYTPGSSIPLSLVTAMNAAGSGFTFSSASVNTGVQEIFVSAPAGRLFSFIGGTGTFSSPHTPGLNGKYLTGIKVPTPMQNRLRFNPMGYYTRYLDLCSTTLTAWTKLGDVASNLPPNWIHRIYLEAPTTSSLQYRDVIQPLRWINYNPSNSLNTVDITVYDEWGNLMYRPTWLTSFTVTLGLIAES